MTGNSPIRERGRAVFLAAVMVLSVVAMSAAVAGTAVADEHDIDISLEDVEGSPGDEVEVELSITSAGGDEQAFDGHDGEIHFDPDVVTLVDWEDGADAFVQVNDENQDEGWIAYSQVTQMETPEEPALTFTWEIEGDRGDATDLEWVDPAVSGAAAHHHNGSVTVAQESDEPAHFAVSDLDVPATAAQGDEVDVSATVENVGDQEATQDVELLVDDDLETSQEVALDGNESATVSFDLNTSDLEPDAYDVAVHSDDDNESAPLEIEHSALTYTTDDGVVETDGLRDAIDDWRTDDIDTDLLREVIDYWRSGDPVA